MAGNDTVLGRTWGNIDYDVETNQIYVEASLSWACIRGLPDSQGLGHALCPIKKKSPKSLLVNRSLPTLYQLPWDLQKATTTKKL